MHRLALDLFDAIDCSTKPEGGTILNEKREFSRNDVSI